MNSLSLFVAPFFLVLLAALFGVGAAFRLSSASPARRPSIGRLAAICILVALLFYPAMFVALQFEFHVVVKGNPGAQGGVLALVIAIGVCTIVSMLATLALMRQP
jgi:uncharacterized membrane protein YwzB